MIRVFVVWEDGSQSEEDFDVDTEATRWSYQTPGVVSAAICERLPENSLMDDIDRTVWICVDCIRPKEDYWRSQPEEAPETESTSKKKRKKR